MSEIVKGNCPICGKVSNPFRSDGIAIKVPHVKDGVIYEKAMYHAHCIQSLQAEVERQKALAEKHLLAKKKLKDGILYDLQAEVEQLRKVEAKRTENIKELFQKLYTGIGRRGLEYWEEQLLKQSK